MVDFLTISANIVVSWVVLIDSPLIAVCFVFTLDIDDVTSLPVLISVPPVNVIPNTSGKLALEMFITYSPYSSVINVSNISSGLLILNNPPLASLIYPSIKCPSDGGNPDCSLLVPTLLI